MSQRASDSVRPNGDPAGAGRNPYDEAEPIPVGSASRHLELSGHPTTFGQQRDLVAQNVAQQRQQAPRPKNQERIGRISQEQIPRIMPAHVPSEEAHRRAEQAEHRAAQPVRAVTAPAAPSVQVPVGANGGFTPLAPMPGMADEAEESITISRRRRGGVVAIILVFALVCAGIVGGFWWFNRPVSVTINGEEFHMQVDSPLREVFKKSHVSVTPGNYVSVGGNVLKEGGGRLFSATVNGNDIAPEALDEYRIAGDEVIVFGDGADLLEEYSAQPEPIAPYLAMDGGGYSLQYISQWGYPGVLEHRRGAESGEDADVVVKEPQNCVVTCRDLFLEGDQKYVAITFDDGPLAPYTEQILDICDQYGVRVTFFNLGTSVQDFPDLARRIAESDHQLASHTMDHLQLTGEDNGVVYEQIVRAEQTIQDTTGIATTHIRPPYGDFTERDWFASRGAITASIRWSQDSNDWELPGAEAIVEHAMADMHSGSIILMHDGGGWRDQTIEAFRMLIERLQGEGYQCVTVSELMRAAGDIPEDICSGTATMPADAVWPDEISPDDIAAAAAAQEG